jgi:hypothetical protein
MESGHWIVLLAGLISRPKKILLCGEPIGGGIPLSGIERGFGLDVKCPRDTTPKAELQRKGKDYA